MPVLFGAPLPSGMSLQDVFEKSKKGTVNKLVGALSNKYYQNPDNLNDRLELFLTTLGGNTLGMNPENASSKLDAVKIINNATFSDSMADALSRASASNELPSNSIYNDMHKAYSNYGLPLWYARMKGMM